METRLNPHEKNMATEILVRNIFEIENAFAESLLSFSDKEFNAVPFPGSWTPAQVGEHIGKSLKGILKVLQGNVKPGDRSPEAKVEKTKEFFLDFNTKFKSSDRFLPSEGIKDRAETIQMLEELFSQLRQVAATTNLSEIALDFSLPGSGEFTRSEWLHFAIIHTQRHLHQLKNMKEIFERAGR